MRPPDITFKSDKHSKRRAERQHITARLYKVEDNKIIYTVDSSEHNKQYYVTIQLLGLTGNKLKSLKTALNSDVKIHCTCAGFLFRGLKFITWKAGVGINKEDRAPDITNPERKGMACKHILVALDQMKKDYQAIYDMFKEQAPKGDGKPQPTDIKDNGKSDSPTEIDLQIVTDFKAACDKLYKDYTDYKKTQPNEGDSFVDSDYFDSTDPTTLLANLSKPVAKSLDTKFIGKLKSLQDILDLIDQKKNGFNILLDSDIKALTRKLNETIKNANEAFINDIILTLICS
jgi:hypothetical protein